MNHRYAYCSKDQDPDQDNEEMPFTPGAGRNMDETPLSMEDTQTAHSFLSDSSLDGAAEALKEEEEDEEEDKDVGVSDGHVEKALVGLSAVAEELGGPPTLGSPRAENGVQNERNGYDLGNHIDKAERQFWDRATEGQNRDLDNCELSLDLTELPRIKI